MKNISLYVHIPFCKQKCFYCDFKSYAGIEELENDYIDALILEIRNKCKGYLIKTLFIGGGTPSYLSENNLSKLLRELNKLSFLDDAEKTIECNPGTLSDEKIKIIKENNINRISMGLQTTKNNLLKNIGRIHTIEEFKANYKRVRELGIENINIDIMFGLPNQTLEDYKETLEDIVKLNPEHISAYSLIIEEGTYFYKLYEEDKLNVPNEDDERKMYEITKEILEKNNYKQYEISNYAKEGRECRHNKVYWDLDEYIGVGVSASSFIDEKRIKNIDNIREYIDRINQNLDVSESIITNSLKEDMEEFMFLGLRMIEGVSIDKFKEKFSKDINDVYGEIINKNKKLGLLDEKNGRIYLTDKGIAVSNWVMSEFIL
ncbi:MAG: oxygen-independent coproporphyrinogen III oxidase [Clostridium baratii]|uniref:Heme chaperone HemW n=1 Tax=Clostridium baratii str. Sullivan TaxID=1415775 RepID=A0A0A7FWR8_9CLOT|nr:radical SAM family heme chaperone HemW [Clostridium baratii]AIY83345.1 radical SAM superfamily protein [Clostridium baratii str. Sullivan]MBS6006438.1 oxygen-independent coproporphyrinogen III oxidase [Clostridium baratii]MDU1053892.1 radical SAM family heme chaperone HemW [Clostridium baratii]MDU4910795.1 radical SAM family heme chaperone HemW [Clostridium baratii]CUO90062.1 coproporphyrinogen III oxidase [Clostridium baratii]